MTLTVCLVIYTITIFNKRLLLSNTYIITTLSSWYWIKMVNFYKFIFLSLQTLPSSKNYHGQLKPWSIWYIYIFLLFWILLLLLCFKTQIQYAGQECLKSAIFPLFSLTEGTVGTQLYTRLLLAYVVLFFSIRLAIKLLNNLYKVTIIHTYNYYCVTSAFVPNNILQNVSWSNSLPALCSLDAVDKFRKPGTVAVLVLVGCCANANLSHKGNGWCISDHPSTMYATMPATDQRSKTWPPWPRDAKDEVLCDCL